MLDAIILEKAGLPAVPVVTDAFDSTAREMAALWGVPDFRFVTMPHPLGSLSAAGIESQAAALVAKTVALLREGQPA